MDWLKQFWHDVLESMKDDDDDDEFTITTKPMEPQTSRTPGNAELFVQAAKESLGQNLSAGTGVPYYVACAISVNKVHQKAFGNAIGGGASTADLYQALLSNPNFRQVGTPSAGCVVISPTGHGTNPRYPHGHTGVVGNFGICSNDSETGLFSENYTVDSWNKQFHNIEGFPVFYFQRL